MLGIKRSVKYDIPPFATMRRLAKLLVACPSAIREIGQTNRRPELTKSYTARSWRVATRVVDAVAANDGNPPNWGNATPTGKVDYAATGVIQHAPSHWMRHISERSKR